MSEIAAELGVSKMTVSRALRGEGVVAPATLARVRQVAKRLKYRPNRLMRAVHTGRSRTVGVMIDPWTSFHSGVLEGIHEALAAHDCLPILHYPRLSVDVDLGKRDQREQAYLHRLLDQRVDGIIFWPTDETVPDLYLQEVWDRGVPLVAVDRQMPATHADFSGTDDVAGGRLAAEHLLGLGHRRLAFIGEAKLATFADRQRAFEARVGEERGASCAVRMCRHSDSLKVAHELLALRQRPTAIFCATDWMAHGVYVAAAARNLAIGSDLSVVGFADLREASMLIPPLTTIRQDSQAIGRAAVDLLMDRIEGRVKSTRPRAVRQQPSLVVRKSTGPA